MRWLLPFLASEGSDQRSAMSGRAQASVLRDADRYIINIPSASLLGFTASSLSRQCLPLSVGVKRAASLQR